MGVPAIVAATAVWLTGAWLAAVIRRERRRRLVLAVAASVAMFSLVLAAAFLLLVSLVLSTAMTALAGNMTAALGLAEGVVTLIMW